MRIFEPRIEEVTGGWQEHIKRSLIVYTHCTILERSDQGYEMEGHVRYSLLAIFALLNLHPEDGGFILFRNAPNF
jgi:hypothetical protein